MTLSASMINPSEEDEAHCSHRDTVSKLSRSGLTYYLIAMLIVPIATVLTLWYYLPPVSLHQLNAEILIENLETATQFDRLDKNSPIPEPRILVKNLGSEEWTHLIIELNERYKIYRTEPTESVAPGETLISGLDFFQTREGIFFAPGKIRLRHVRVYARLPSGSRATYETQWNAE
ncbi:MAG: hypothetical protein VX438_18660 [Planctomycetota bacterium]|nr:hypothetical protein [Planctomycetota bacterium]